MSAARDVLIASFERAAHGRTWRYRRYRVDQGDLEQIAMMAVITAVDSFEPGRGATMETWVRRNVEWALSEEVKRLRRQSRLRMQPMGDKADRSHDRDDAADASDNLWEAMEKIPHADQERLIDHYGMDGYAPMTFKQLGLRAGYSRHTASNQNRDSLQLLRVALQA